MGEKLRIAIIGLGSRGKNAYGTELLTLQDRAVVTAVADPNEERADFTALKSCWLSRNWLTLPSSAHRTASMYPMLLPRFAKAMTF